MKQSSVADTKRKSIMLFQQSSMLESSSQITQYRAKNLSRTLYLMSSMSCKRFEHDDSSQKEETKKLKITEERDILSTSLNLISFLSLESRYSLNQYRVISSVKLMKTWELILDQVDWFEVM